MERKYLLLIAGILVAVIGVAWFFAAYFPTPRGPIMQNLYERTWNDLWGLLSLDVVIRYETEADGTWRRSTQVRYNITVLVKPTYVNESVMSKAMVIHWDVGGIPISNGWGGLPYLPEEPAPIGYGIDLMGFWFNQSAWRVVSRIYQPSMYDLPPRPTPDYSILTYGFMIREILTNNTSSVFNIGDFLSVSWSG